MAQEIADSKLLDTWSSSGTKIEPDISKIMEGWQLGEQPPHEYMNWLQNTFGSKLNHILKNGIAEWNNETEYLSGSSVQHNGSIWLSKTTNINSEPTDLNANWGKVAINKDLTVTVDTLADLKNISYPANTVWVSGYHTKNDGAFGSYIFRLKGVKTTETDNGGTVIIATGGGVDYVYELQYDGAVNVKWFGAKGDDTTDDTTPIINALNYLPQNSTLCGSGKTYKITDSISFNKRCIIRNLILKQYTKIKDVIKITGSLAFSVELNNVGLIHTFNDNDTGSLVDISSSGAVGFFRWHNSLGISSGGKYGVRSHGGTYMMDFYNLWIDNTYSSGFYLPSSGDIVNTSQLGGSTTTTFKKVFVTNIQTEAEAYSIGAGYDTVSLDTCSADNVSKFGFFKCSPLFIKNCSSEKIRNPIVGSLTGPHMVMDLAAGIGQNIDGFHVTFDAGFVAPYAGGGNVNSFARVINASNLFFSGVRGSIPSTYYGLDLQGGEALLNCVPLGLGLRAVLGAKYRTSDKNTREGAYVFDRLTSNGDIVDFQRDGVSVGAIGSISGGNFLIKATRNATTLVTQTLDNSGVAYGTSLNANVMAFFPSSDNNISNGRSAYRWSVIYAGTGTINTSDDREKTYLEITDIEKQVALELKDNMRKFKFNDAIAKKGEDKTRIHFGASAQTVKSIFEKYGLDGFDYAILCYDEWEDEYEQLIETPAEYDEEGNEIKAAIFKQGDLLTPAGNRFGIRYEELLCFIMSAL